MRKGILLSLLAASTVVSVVMLMALMPSGTGEATVGATPMLEGERAADAAVTAVTAAGSPALSLVPSLPCVLGPQDQGLGPEPSVLWHCTVRSSTVPEDKGDPGRPTYGVVPSDTITLTEHVHLPLVARGYASIPLEAVEEPLQFATGESWSWESCDAAHDGDEGEWWPGCDQGFVAQVRHGGEEPWAWWDFYRGFAWVTVPEVEGEVVSAALRMPLCYSTDWPTQTGQVAFHFGTWPGSSPLDEEAMAAWSMYEPEPFVVLNSEGLPRAYGRVVGGTCDRDNPTYVEIPLPLDRVRPGEVLRVLARDGRDAEGCGLEERGNWGLLMIRPRDPRLRLYVKQQR